VSVPVSGPVRSRPRPLESRQVGALRVQLDRASASIVLNLAEGAGRRTAADKCGFYVIARGSAMECAAILDVLASRGVLSAEAHGRGRGLLDPLRAAADVTHHPIRTDPEAALSRP
jgi:four helix bundle protein